jgi:hypothetical protein
MTGTALDHVLIFLVPIFLRGAQGDAASARRAAIQLLDSQGAVGDRDTLLAAEIIAFSLATVNNLGQSMADPDMPVATSLRLCASASALSRGAERNRKALERARKADAQSPSPPGQHTATLEVTEQKAVTLPTTIQKVHDAIVQAAPALAETLTNAGQTMSRQQRRFIERKAEQARVSHERAARKLARVVQRESITA